MYRLWIRSIPLLLCVVQYVSTSKHCHADPLVSGDRLLPKDTLVFFTISNIAELKKKFGESSMGQLIQEPQLKPFLDDAYKLLGEKTKEAEEILGLSITNLLELPNGQLTIAMLERPKAKFSIVAVLEYGDRQQNVDTFLKEMDEALEKQGYEHSTDEIEKTPVHVYSHKSGGKENPFKTIAYFTDQSSLVISTEIAALKEILNRWDGSSDDVLGENNAYKYIQAQCKPESDEPLMKVFANPIGLVNSSMSLFPQAALAAPLFIPMIGVDELKGWGGALDFNDGDFDQIANFFIYDENPKGLLRFFLFPSSQLAPPQWVPANAELYVALNWDLESAFKSIESFYDNFQGAGATSKFLDKLAERDPGIHVKKDLIDHLDGRIHLFESEAKESTGENDKSSGYVVSAGLKDASKMKKTLAVAAKSVSVNIETREFNGETIYEIGDTDNEPSQSVAVTDGMIVSTTDAHLLEQVIRGQSGRGSSLLESPEYQRVAKHFPSKTSMVWFQTRGSSAKGLYESAKNDGNDSIEGIDFSKLPPFEVIAKYIAPTGSYIVTDKKGCKWVTFSLKRAD